MLQTKNWVKIAIAVTADYKTLSSEELDSAKSVAREIGITHHLIEYSELENENFVKMITKDASIAVKNYLKN